jgi:hypothetical protein
MAYFLALPCVPVKADLARGLVVVVEEAVVGAIAVLVSSDDLALVVDAGGRVIQYS